MEEESSRFEKWSKELEKRINRKIDWINRVKSHEKDIDWNKETIFEE